MNHGKLNASNSSKQLEKNERSNGIKKSILFHIQNISMAIQGGNASDVLGTVFTHKTCYTNLFGQGEKTA